MAVARSTMGRWEGQHPPPWHMLARSSAWTLQHSWSRKEHRQGSTTHGDKCHEGHGDTWPPAARRGREAWGAQRGLRAQREAVQ